MTRPDELRTALVVLVPQAEPVVSALRFRHDPMALRGVPAHLSVLYPFVPAHSVDSDLLDSLTPLFAAVPGFAHQLNRTGWFGADVLWLGSDADERLRSLTEQVWSAFPDHPPYGGAFDEIVPHLTVASRGSPDELEAAERSVAAHLPIDVATRTVTLLVEQPSRRWHAAADFPLA